MGALPSIYAFSGRLVTNVSATNLHHSAEISCSDSKMMGVSAYTDATIGCRSPRVATNTPFSAYIKESGIMTDKIFAFAAGFTGYRSATPTSFRGSNLVHGGNGGCYERLDEW